MGTYEQNLAVLYWTLPCVTLGAILFWYGWRLEDELEPDSYSGLELLTIVMRIVGGLLAGIAALFAGIAFAMALILGLSTWWLVIPGVIVGYPIWLAEQRISYHRVERGERDRARQEMVDRMRRRR